jgi:ankyrin repeat protein
VAQRSSDLAAFLIEKGANPRTANKHRETPLHIAAAQGSAETVSLLLRAGADPEARDGKELTPLEVAQKAGRREAAAFLYEATGRDHAAVANHRKAPVTRSQPLPGLRAVLERLGEAGRAISAEPRPALAAAAAAASPAAAAPANAPQRKQPATNERQQPHHILGHGGSALALAAYFGLEDVAKALLTARVPPDAPASEDVVSKLADEAPLLLLRDRSPLIIAAEQGHLGVVRLLLSHGADTARRTRHGHGPLSVAARDGHLAVVRELAGRGIGSDESDKWGMNPLHLAISQGEAAVAEALVSAFPAMLTARASDGLTAVALAASQENDTVLRSLLRREEARALVNATDVDGQTPLHVAAQQGHVSPVRTLVEHGAPVDARDREGTTPLMLACRRGNADVAAALLSLGADMNARDIHNQTALTACAIASRYSGNDEALRLLIARGADLSALTPQLRELPSVAAALKGVADRSRS